MKRIMLLCGFLTILSSNAFAYAENKSCISPSADSGLGKEILNQETGYAYAAGGSNPMPDDVWLTYQPSEHYVKNTDRYMEFTGSCVYRSPSAEISCTGDKCFVYKEIDGYTWLEILKLNCNSCLTAGKMTHDKTCAKQVKPYQLRIAFLEKCQSFSYEKGTQIYELTDPHGAKFVMDATSNGTPSLAAKVPKDWTLSSRVLDDKFRVEPTTTNCYFTKIYDNLQQAYMQYTFKKESDYGSTCEKKYR